MNTSPPPSKVEFFDTTLRDGRQCPGASMSDAEYFSLVREIDATGFDIIETGFPASSLAEATQVYATAQMAGSGEIQATVAGLCQLRKEQVDITIRSLEPAIRASK